MNTQKLLTSLCVGLSIAVAGCGGGSGGGESASTDASTSGVVQPTPAPAPAVSGRLMDGYISGATVFWDCNDNLSLDASELSVVSGAGGSYTLAAAPSVSCNLRADVPATAFDEGKNARVGTRTIMGALPGKSDLITPLTSLVSIGGLTESQVASKLGTTLPIGTDYVAAGSNGLVNQKAASVGMQVLGSVSGVIKVDDVGQRQAIVTKATNLVDLPSYSFDDSGYLSDATVNLIRGNLPTINFAPRLQPFNLVLDRKAIDRDKLTEAQVLALTNALSLAKTFPGAISGSAVHWDVIPETERLKIGAAQYFPSNSDVEKLRIDLHAKQAQFSEKIEQARKASNVEDSLSFGKAALEVIVPTVTDGVKILGASPL
jgi:hypothetical protein